MKFDFNKIKLKSSKEPSLTKKLTGEVVSELKPIGKGIQPNAELEGNEFLQFPDGKIQKVEGRSHKKSGVKMNIPDGTKILSNKLKLSASNVKEIKEQFDIKLNTNTTFAKAQDKFDKKLGIKELNEEQEKQIKELEKQLERGDIDEGTFRINQEYLSKQIYDSEKGKNEKQSMRSMFFNFLFALQEEGKSEPRKAKAEEGNFMYGGMKGSTKKFALGGIKMYADGGGEPDPEKVYEDLLYMYNVSQMAKAVDNGTKSAKEFSDLVSSKEYNERINRLRGYNMTIHPINNWPKPTRPDKSVPVDRMLQREHSLQDKESKKSYTEAYETVDKNKYPTLEAFVADAEYYKKNRRNMPAEELAKVIAQSTTTPEADIEPKDMPVDIGKLPTRPLQVATPSILPMQPTTQTGTDKSSNLVEARQWDAKNKRWVTSMVPEGSALHKQTMEREAWAQKNLPEGETLKWNEELGKYEKVKEVRYKFENGGLSDAQFAKLCNKFGISKEQGMKMLNNRMKRFANGGTQDGGEPEWMFNPGYGRTRFAELERERQHRSDAAYGTITKDNIKEVMESLYRNFPDIVRDPKVFGVTFDENGDIKWDESLDFSQVTENVREFQKRADARMRESANVIINNPEMFSPEQVESAKSFIEQETFLEDDAGTVRGYDAKLGQFTSGRYNIGMDVVTPDELKILREKNINTVSDLQKALETEPSLIGDASKKRLEALSGIMTENSDFALSSFTPAEEEPAPEEPVDEKKIEDDIKLPRRKRGLGFLNIPDIAPLPPSGLQAMYAPESRFGFADPFRIGIKEEIQTTGDMMRMMGDQIMDLPPQQRAIVLAQFQAERNQQLNEAAQKANVINAQNLSSTELFNVGQIDRMYAADVANKLGFEKNQLTAQALTQEDWKNYYDDAIKRAMHRYGVKSALGLLSTLTPDVSLDADMAGVSYDPSEEWQIQAANNFTQLFGNPFV